MKMGTDEDGRERGGGGVRNRYRYSEKDDGDDEGDSWTVEEMKESDEYERFLFGDL